MTRDAKPLVVLLHQAAREKEMEVLVELAGVERPRLAVDLGFTAFGVQRFAREKPPKEPERREGAEDVPQEPQIRRGGDGGGEGHLPDDG